jgi:protein TonB
MGRAFKSMLLLPVFVGSSLVLHGVALAVMNSIARDRFAANDLQQPPMELVMVEVEPPPPPVAPQSNESPKPPIKIAEVKKPKPKHENAPPPPNEEARPESAKEAPLATGITMSSTSAAGDFAAPLGNTAYGKSPEQAPAPSAVNPYSAPKYSPLSEVDREPKPVYTFEIEYPRFAKEASIEGTVLLALMIDNEGKVSRARVLKGPHSKLNEAAREAALKFKFTPALKGGQPVATEIMYKYTFELK